MMSFLQLNLQSDPSKAPTPDPNKPAVEEPNQDQASKRINRIARKASRKAAGEFRRGGGSGIFTK